MGYFGLIVQKNGGYCESYDGLRGGKYRHTNCEYGEKSKNCWRGKTEEEKKVIKAAKLKLMNDYEYDEQGAHRYLQKKSMDHGINIVEMAYMILNNTDSFW